jgi:hypothetical protein
VAWFREAPDAERDFARAVARLGIAWPMGGQGQAALRLSGGASSGSPPVPYRFTLESRAQPPSGPEEPWKRPCLKASTP